MTFRVQRSTVDNAVVMTLSGDIVGDAASDLQAIVDAEREQRLVLDL